jgi:GMP synthase-like glutamine amidotransferase
VGLRIGLLMVGHVDPKSVHIAGDYPELFAALLAGHDVELVRYDLDEGRFPDSPAECDGWMCGPSRSSAYDPLSWRADAEELLRRIVAGEHPYVGICFGHQLLAQAHGAPVERAADGWQVGLRAYDVATTQPWMDEPVSSISLIASHEDQVLALPAGASLLVAGADGGCPVAGFTLGPRAWTLQPHPEFVPELADHLLAGRVELIGAEKVARARATLGGRSDRARVAGWIARFFARTTYSGSQP